MTEDRVLEILESYGGDKSRWPAAERETALDLIAATPALRFALADAEELDRRIAAWSTPAPHPAAVERIIAAARLVTNRRPWAWGSAIVVAAAAAVVFALIPLKTPQSPSVESALDSDAMALVYTPIDGIYSDETL
jgi:hypothetical protein